jgi:pimeloyl-ACP methyl ester carboxylesterase
MTHAPAVEGHVTSRDGTRIGYRRHGEDGPGIVLVQGAMGDVHSYDELAQALSPTFTVYALERRGRGVSPKPYDPSHDIARDVEDIDALLEQTGTEFVFGLSSGAVITLEAARTLPRITRAALYEPPFYRDGISREGVRCLDAEVERGDLPAAMITSLLTAQTAPAPLRVLPRPVSRFAASIVLRVDERRPRPGATLRQMVPGNRYDFHDVAGVDGKMAMYAGVDKPVLLVSGTKSQAFLRESVRDLMTVLPQARLVELPGLDHGSPWNAAQGGRPVEVAAPLVEFFSAQAAP